MGATTLTTDEQAGLAQFEASIERARAIMTGEQFALRLQATRASLENGAALRMKNAPSQGAIDAMIAVLDAATTPATPEPAAEPTASPTGYTRIIIAANGREFAKAVNWAKGQRGKYDPQTKTWLIPSSSNFLNAPGLYGWRIVK